MAVSPGARLELIWIATGERLMNQDNSRLRSGLLFRRIVDEGLLLDLRDDAGYRLNDVATSILDLLSQGVEEKELVDRLCAEFEIDRERCAREVSDFLAELAERELLES